MTALGERVDKLYSRLDREEREGAQSRVLIEVQDREIQFLQRKLAIHQKYLKTVILVLMENDIEYPPYYWVGFTEEDIVAIFSDDPHRQHSVLKDSDG